MNGPKFPDQEPQKLYPSLPIIDTPLTRLTEHWMTYQNGRCSDFEMDYTRCAALCGRQRAATECRLYWEDLMECVTKDKTNRRVEAIKKEHKKQKKYSETPPMESIITWHMMNNFDMNS